MARPFHTILIVFALAFNGATPSMATVSDGHSQIASSGITTHVMQGGGPESSRYKPETSDWNGSCGNFCLDCGCLICEARNLSDCAAAEIMVASDHFPSPRLFDQAPRVDQDVAKPPPKP